MLTLNNDMAFRAPGCLDPCSNAHGRMRLDELTMETVMHTVACLFLK